MRTSTNLNGGNMANISIDDMATEIMKGLTEYADLVTTDMKKAVKVSSTLAKNEIKANAPVDSGDYANSWATMTNTETSNSLEMTVYSKNRGSLTHLLENGHANRNGGRTKAYPHISQAEQSATQKLEDEILKGLS